MPNPQHTFMEPTMGGNRIIHITFIQDKVRILAYLQSCGEREPISLYLDEIEEYITKARKEVKRQG